MQHGHRYINLVEPGQVGFFSTNCLGHAYVMERPEIKDVICYQLCDNCIFYGAELRAFVAMSNHLHFVGRMPDDKSGSQFVQKFKERSAKVVLPLLNEFELSLLAANRRHGLRKFWEWRFDSFPLTGPDAYEQKINYIHQNPVKAEMAEDARAYKWSSARLIDEFGIATDNGITHLAIELFRGGTQHHGC